MTPIAWFVFACGIVALVCAAVLRWLARRLRDEADRTLSDAVKLHSAALAAQCDADEAIVDRLVAAKSRDPGRPMPREIKFVTRERL